MKILSIILLSILLTSCLNRNEKMPQIKQETDIYGTPTVVYDTTDRYGFRVIVIDSCEYMVHGDGEGLCHMGTCKNPKHKK